MQKILIISGGILLISIVGCLSLLLLPFIACLFLMCDINSDKRKSFFKTKYNRNSNIFS